MTLRYLADLVKAPVLLLALGGIVLAWRMARARIVVPATLLVWGCWDTRFLKHPGYGPFDQGKDSPRIQVPPEGFARAEVGRRFTAYVRCEGWRGRRRGLADGRRATGPAP